MNDVLDVFTHITGFGQSGGIGDGERYVEQARQRFRQQGLARTGRTDEQDIALAQLDVVFLLALIQTLVMVVDSNGEDPLGTLLTNDILVEDGADFLRRWQLVRIAFGLSFLDLLADDVIAQVDAFVADEDGGSSDQFTYFVLTLAAEGAVKQLAVIVAIARICHSIDPMECAYINKMEPIARFFKPTRPNDRRLGRWSRRGQAGMLRFSRTLSIKP